MGFLNFLRRPDINEGLVQFERTPGAVLLDVRTRQEYAQGHLPGSRNVPLDELEQAELPDRDAPLFVYCLSGGRSARAADRKSVV